MDECSKVDEYIAQRGFRVIERKRHSLYAALGDLYISFWCPEGSTIFDVDPLELADELRLFKSDVLVVIAYRPFLIIDEIQSVLDRINRWYGRDLSIKLIGINVYDMEEGLEEAVGHAMVYRPFKIGQSLGDDDMCPNCLGSRLKVFVSEKIFSTKYRSLIRHVVLGCPSCGLRIRRIEVLS